MFLEHNVSGVLTPPSGLNIVIKSIQADTIEASGVSVSISGSFNTFADTFYAYVPTLGDIVFKSNEQVYYSATHAIASITYIYGGSPTGYKYNEYYQQNSNLPSRQNWQTQVLSGSYQNVG